MVSKEETMKKIAACLTLYENTPRDGFNFLDIFPVLRDPVLYNNLIDLMVEEITTKCPKPNAILGLESRGFLFAPSIALKINTAFVPIRKAGKLPGEKFSVDYELEYGKDSMEVAKESVKERDVVVIVDDILATGGTLKAALKLMQMAKVQVVCMCVVVRLKHFTDQQHFNAPLLSMMLY